MADKEIGSSLINWLSNLDPHIWIFILSMWGGLISYFTRLRSGIIESYSTSQLLLELASSAFSGVITYYICSAAGFGGFMTASLVGISGHMGSRLLTEIERSVISRIKRKDF